ncbi:MAG TPA: protease complex subunit PrcB family protein [Candidatus Thermoplasmatota archaeon]|jgi:hypothetical protein|nr:protease complex subunit PrcB family protein [Candidatus Thermoplasmatota archaeon]
MRLLMLAMAALLLAGCTNPQTTAGPSVDRALSFERIEGCSGQQAAEKYVVARTQAEWDRLWAESCQGEGADIAVGEPNPSAPAPTIDFARQHVVAAFWGEKNTGGYGIQVLNITEKDDHVGILVQRGTAGPNCMTIEVLTYPSDLVASERFTKAERFVFEDVVKDCN